MDAQLLMERLRPVVAAQPGVAVAWLFGSGARGDMRPDSDVDVGVVFTPDLPAVERERVLVDLSSRLEALTAPHPIEVVALEDQGYVFIHSALRDGKRIVVNDEERRVDFESEALVRYLDWKPTWDLAANEQQQGMRLARETATHMNGKGIETKLGVLRDNLARLATLPQTDFAEFAADFRNVDSALHRLQTSFQALMDLGSYKAGRRGLPPPDSSRDILTALEGDGALPRGTADR